VAEVAATVAIPGRLELIAESPPTYVDAAHNPDGAAALAEALPALAGGRRVVGCLSILADKDADEMVRALAPALERAVCTELPRQALEAHGRPGAASRPASELVAACEAAGLPAEAEPDLETALRRASRLAAEPPEGVLVVAGSHYGIAPARATLGTAALPEGGGNRR
jgi:dihydrofolate synthase/folylpolyglutamate synthase